jgi:hypothetical protein
MPRCLLAVLLLLVACSAAPPRPARQHAAIGSAPATVLYVIKRKWHVDIGFAVVDLAPPLAALRADFPDARYLLFGFGDRHYLLDEDRGFTGALSALWPGPGVMLVTGLTATLQAAFGVDNVIALPVTAAQARDAQDFVWRALSTGGDTVAALRAGPYQGSRYYATSQRYSALHTCNTWAAQTLAAAGLPAHSVGVLFSAQLWAQVQRLAQNPPAESTGTEQPGPNCTADACRPSR